MNNKKHIVYLGCTGFPYGMAEMEKLILISKSLVITNNNVTVISNQGVNNRNDHPDLKATGYYQQIEYVYTSGDPFYNENFINRNILKLKGWLNEISFLKKRKRDKKLDIAILSTNSFTSVLYYVMLAKIIGFKTILNHVEYYSAIKKKWYQIGTIVNHKLYDSYAPKLVTGIFPISKFLIDRLNKMAPKKPYLKIPTLTEFEKYNNTEILNIEKYFLFCGSAIYKEVISFIIDSFNLLNNSDIFLFLVINGNESDVNEVKKYISASPKKNKIKFLSKLSQKDLLNYYRNSLALLIPLRPTFQDIARFPHKFGEYLASGNPVITTNYGEVRNYFQDMENMLIAETYETNKFAEKMEFVIDNKELAKKIGLNGKEIALQIFNYQSKGKEISEFIHSIS